MSYLLSRCVFCRAIKSHIRLLGSQISQPERDGLNYQMIYSLSYARVGAVVNSIKYKQMFLTGLIYPVCLALEYQNIVPDDVATASLVIGVVSNIAFYSMGQLFYRLVGKIYWCEEKQLAKIAYVGFFGRREEIEIPIDSISSLEGNQIGKLYSKFEVSEPTRIKLKINEDFFEFGDRELLRRIFGSFGR